MVEFEKKEEAEKAITQMNKSQFLEKELGVGWAFAVEKDTKL